MAFAVFADGSSNLPKSRLEGVTLLPCDYTMNDEPVTYDGDVDNFDGHTFYENLRHGAKVRTSLLNTQLFVDHFTPVLKEGRDIIYVSMSSGISGTFNAARIAAEELMEAYPERYVHIVDSHGCGFGIGLLVIKAARLSKEGLSARDAGAILDEDVPHMCQYFTVDDLNFLKSTGRVSGAAAVVGTLLNIKPILYGNTEGKIVTNEKVRGLKKAIDAIAATYGRKVVDASSQTVFISHGDCPEAADQLAAKVKAIAEPGELIICQHEPFSGCHVGPGMLALFFYGTER